MSLQEPTGFWPTLITLGVTLLGAVGTAFKVLWTAHKDAVEATKERLDECEEDRKELHIKLDEVRDTASHHEAKIAGLESRIELISHNPESRNTGS